MIKNEPINYQEFYNDLINERLADREQLINNFTLWKENEITGESSYQYELIFHI